MISGVLGFWGIRVEPFLHRLGKGPPDGLDGSRARSPPPSLGRPAGSSEDPPPVLIQHDAPETCPPHVLPLEALPTRERYRVVSINVNSHINTHLLEGVHAHMLAMQETRHTTHTAARLQSGYAAVQRQFLPGLPKKIYASKRTKRLNPDIGERGGVCALLSKELRARPFPPLNSATLEAAAAAGRWRKFRAATHGKGCGVVVYNLYGCAGANQSPEARRQVNDLLLATLEDAAQHRCEPVLVLGDFNLSPHKAPLLQAAFAIGDWWDPCDPTLVGGPGLATTTRGHKIDYILLNSAAKAAYVQHWHVLVPGIGPHFALVVDFSWDKQQQPIWVWSCPRPLPEPEDELVRGRGSRR